MTNSSSDSYWWKRSSPFSNHSYNHQEYNTLFWPKKYYSHNYQIERNSYTQELSQKYSQKEQPSSEYSSYNQSTYNQPIYNQSTYGQSSWKHQSQTPQESSQKYQLLKFSSKPPQTLSPKFPQEFSSKPSSESSSKSSMLAFHFWSLHLFKQPPEEALYEAPKRLSENIKPDSPEAFIIDCQTAKKHALAKKTRLKWKKEIKNKIWNTQIKQNSQQNNQNKQQSNQQIKQIKQYSCKRCSKIFAFKRKLHEHLQQKHDKCFDQKSEKQASQHIFKCSISDIQTIISQSPQHALPPRPAFSFSPIITVSTAPTTPPAASTSLPPAQTSAPQTKLSYAEITKQTSHTPPKTFPIILAASPKTIIKQPHPHPHSHTKFSPRRQPFACNRQQHPAPPRTWMTMQELFDRFRGKPHPAIPSPKTTGTKPKQVFITKSTLSPTAIPFRMRPSAPHPHHRRSPLTNRLPISKTSVNKASVNKASVNKASVSKTFITSMQTPQIIYSKAWLMNMMYAWQTYMQYYRWIKNLAEKWLMKGHLKKKNSNTMTSHITNSKKHCFCCSKEVPVLLQQRQSMRQPKQVNN